MHPFCNCKSVICDKGTVFVLSFHKQHKHPYQPYCILFFFHFYMSFVLYICVCFVLQLSHFFFNCDIFPYFLRWFVCFFSAVFAFFSIFFLGMDVIIFESEKCVCNIHNELCVEKECVHFFETVICFFWGCLIYVTLIFLFRKIAIQQFE